MAFEGAEGWEFAARVILVKDANARWMRYRARKTVLQCSLSLGAQRTLKPRCRRLDELTVRWPADLVRH